MLSRTDYLTLSHDGAIPRALMAAAREADRAEDLPTGRPHPASVESARPRLKRNLVQEIAEAIVARTTEEGCCTETDLRRLGFSKAQLADHGPAALRRAADLQAEREAA